MAAHSRTAQAYPTMMPSPLPPATPDDPQISRIAAMIGRVVVPLTGAARLVQDLHRLALLAQARSENSSTVNSIVPVLLQELQWFDVSRLVSCQVYNKFALATACISRSLTSLIFVPLTRL